MGCISTSVRRACGIGLRETQAPAARAAACAAIAIAVSLASPSDALAKKSKEIYVAYAGPHRSDDEVATLRLGKVDWVQVDEIRVDRGSYRELKLLPRSYRIQWGNDFGSWVAAAASGKHTEVQDLRTSGVWCNG